MKKYEKDDQDNKQVCGRFQWCVKRKSKPVKKEQIYLCEGKIMEDFI